MILLDSSVLIDLFRKKNKEKSFFYSLTKLNQDFAISTITHYEIGIGNKEPKDLFWNRLYDGLTILPFDKDCSDIAIEIYLNLRKRNKLIDLADLLIGATAITYNCPLATLNKKHFERIDKIKLQE